LSALYTKKRIKDQEQSAAVRFNGGWQAMSGVKE
jgi:hypothetical protein